MTTDLHRPVDPRLVRTRESVLHAAGELLVAGGAGSVTIEKIVERSGVARSTIYRHWRSQPLLVLDAFKALLVEDRGKVSGRQPVDADVRSRLIFLVGALGTGLEHSRWAPAVSSLVELAERDSEMRSLLRGFLDEILEPARGVIAQAVSGGELPIDFDTEAAVELLLAPVFFRRLLKGMSFGFEDATRLVDRVLGMRG